MFISFKYFVYVLKVIVKSAFLIVACQSTVSVLVPSSVAVGKKTYSALCGFDKKRQARQF